MSYVVKIGNGLSCIRSDATSESVARMSHVYVDVATYFGQTVISRINIVRLFLF